MTTRGLANHDAKEHEHHLCRLVAERRIREVADLSKNGRYMCRICGRVAADARHVCEPVPM